MKDWIPNHGIILFLLLFVVSVVPALRHVQVAVDGVTHSLPVDPWTLVDRRAASYNSVVHENHKITSLFILLKSNLRLENRLAFVLSTIWTRVRHHCLRAFKTRSTAKLLAGECVSNRIRTAVSPNVAETAKPVVNFQRMIIGIPLQKVLHGQLGCHFSSISNKMYFCNFTFHARAGLRSLVD